MTDFIITMLMITLLNVLLGTVAFIFLMIFSRRIEAKNKLDVEGELNIVVTNEVTEQLNIREYSMNILDYLPIATIISPAPVSKNEQNAFFYTTRKIKRGYNRHKSNIKVHSRHRAAYNFDTAFTVKEYLQNVHENETHDTSLEFHRLAVPCG